MTEQQQTARIEFVKKLLVANGFVLDFRISSIQNGCTYLKNDSWVVFKNEYLTLQSYNICRTFLYCYPLKPLRDFIKLSNQNPI